MDVLQLYPAAGRARLRFRRFCPSGGSSPRRPSSTGCRWV